MARDMIAVLGQDMRMDYVASYLYHMGYEVSQEYKEADHCDILILPPVLKQEDEDMLENSNFMGSVVYYGNMPEKYTQMFHENQAKIFSYLTWEKLIAENAFLTAMGIVREAKMQNAVLRESHCLVTGYGYCGKAIAKQLLEQNARVDVMVRRKELKREIEDEGYEYVPFSHHNQRDFQKYSYIFNTVPSLVLDESLLEHVSRNILIFDIASAPGGTDFGYCKQKKIQAGLYLGIPGKAYPKEAGEAIAKNILSHIEDNSFPPHMVS